MESAFHETHVWDKRNCPFETSSCDIVNETEDSNIDSWYSGIDEVGTMLLTSALCRVVSYADE
jgi:hypothetical protein